MKLFLIFVFLVNASGYAQTLPIRWVAGASRQPENKYLLHVRATVPQGWYIYAALDTALGIDPLSVSWDNDRIQPLSDLRQMVSPVSIRDRVFNKSLPVFQNGVDWQQTIEIKGVIPTEFKISIHGFAANGKEFQPLEETKFILLEGGADPNGNNGILLSTVHLDRPAASCGDTPKTNSGIASLFLLGTLGGLLALLTPCVFPMIPVTVSFFMNKAKTRNEALHHGLLYGTFILLIYLLASLPFHLLTNINPEILNSVSTNAWVNLSFFVIFIIFSLSFFGLFDISLPASILTKTDSKSTLGSIPGIFFMALTLATVSFSCTGPILGSLLVGSLSSSGGAWQLTAGTAFRALRDVPGLAEKTAPQWRLVGHSKKSAGLPRTRPGL